jgi:hypothetical protein
MYNRKFDIKKDFTELNELENKILPLLKNEVKNKESELLLRTYIQKLFFNQFKK